MNHTYLKYTLFALTAVFAPLSRADELVILHTNDTHSQIDPDSKDGLGGIARRKVVVDSVRNARENVLLIDAGDAVQGSLYFNIYGGEVEQKLMNKLEYDIRILGNHEFDNGIDSLASVLKLADSQFLATNYDLSDTPLAPIFDKYAIREIDGHKIGFIALNLSPKGMISEGNYDGLEYLDATEAANSSAWWLRNIEGCDMVVAVTHVGYDPEVPPGDLYLANNTSGIDIFIGGHSHDMIDPATDKFQWRVKNRDGQDVLITQVGKAGKAVGQIVIDLDNLTTDYSLIPVDSHLDDRLDPEVTQIIDQYRTGVDQLMARPVGTTATELDQLSDALLNWTTDIVYQQGSALASDIDFAILNKGGIRRGLPKGTITEGEIMTMLPFDNRITVIDIKGADLLPAFKQMAEVGGNGISSQARAQYTLSDPDNPKSAQIKTISIGGKPLDPDKTYRVATIDYVANGGDYMPTLANHTVVARSKNILYDDVLNYIRSLRGKKARINPDSTARFTLAK